MLRASISTVVMIAMALLTAGTAAPQAPKETPKTKTDPKGKNEPPKEAEDKFSLKGKVADITFGTHISGPKLAPDDLRGRVVLLDYWGIKCAPCLAAMPGMAALYTELADYGLVILGSHVQDDGTPEQIRITAAGKGATFPIAAQTRVRGEDDVFQIPHCYLFDHTGTCIFRGTAEGLEPRIRVALGTAIVAGAGKEKFSAPLQPVVKDLKAGKSPAALLPKLVSLKGGTGDTATEALALLDSMTAPGLKKMKDAEALQEKDALAAYLLIEKVPSIYKGAPVAAKATELLGKLKKDKIVVAELAARPALAAVKKLELPLVGTADGARLPEYQKKHATELKQLKAKIAEMKKTWPDTHATKEALEIAERYGIELN